MIPHNSSDLTAKNIAVAINSQWVQGVTTITFACLLLVAVYQTIQSKCRCLKLPNTVFAFLVGMSLCLIGVQTDPESFKPVRVSSCILLLILLPPLVLDSTFSIDYHIFLKSIKSCLLLSGPGMLFTASSVAFFCKMVLDTNNYGESWQIDELFLLGAALSATDLDAVGNSLKELRSVPHLEALIEGESMLNDATAYLLFEVVTTYHNQVYLKRTPHAEEMFVLFLVGVPFGWMMATVTCFWVSYIREPRLESTIVVVMNYLTFIIADKVIYTSGILACVTLGLIMSSQGKYNLSPEGREHLYAFSEEIASWANTIIYVIAGYTVYADISIVHDKLSELVAFHWIIVVVIYIFLHFSRGCVVAMFYRCLSSPKWGKGLNWKESVLLIVSGLRGSVTLILGLIVAENKALTENKRLTMNFIISCIVLFTGVINGSFTQLVFKWLKLNDSEEKEMLLEQFMSELFKHVQNETVQRVLEDALLSQAYWPEVQKLLGAEIREEELLGQFDPSNYEDHKELQAAASNDVFYFKQKPHLKSSDPHILMALHIALAKGHKDIIEIFEERDKDSTLQSFNAHKSTSPIIVATPIQSHKSPLRQSRLIQESASIDFDSQRSGFGVKGFQGMRKSIKTNSNMMTQRLSNFHGASFRGRSSNILQRASLKPQMAQGISMKNLLSSVELPKVRPSLFSPQPSALKVPTLSQNTNTAKRLDKEGLVILVFNALRAQYRSQFESNFLGDDSIVMLVEAADCAKDVVSKPAKNDSPETAEDAIREALWIELAELLRGIGIREDGTYIKKRRDCGKLTKFLYEKQTVDNYYNGIESLGGYVRAHLEVEESMQHSKQILSHLDHITTVAKKVLVSFMLEQKEKAISCINYIASRYQLGLQRSTVKELSEEGLLIPEWEDELLLKVDEQVLELPTPYEQIRDQNEFFYTPQSIQKKAEFIEMWEIVLKIEKEQHILYIKKFYKATDEKRHQYLDPDEKVSQHWNKRTRVVPEPSKDEDDFTQERKSSTIEEKY